MSNATSQSIDALGEKIAEVAVHVGAATRTLLTHIREFDVAGGYAKQGAKSCAAWLSWRLGMDGCTAREYVRVARSLADFPQIDEEFRLGKLPYSKVRAITRVARPETETTLIDLAKHTTGAQLETACQKYRSVQPIEPRDLADRRGVSRRDIGDGFMKVDIVLRKDEAAMLYTLLNQIAARNEPEPSSEIASAEVPGVDGPRRALRAKRFDRADALMQIIETQMRGERVNQSPVEMIVVVDKTTGTGTTTDGTVLSKESVEMHTCTAGIVEVTTDADGNALDVGRKYRFVTEHIKRALRERDPVCQFPGCTFRTFLRAHHIIPWSVGGTTSLEQTIHLCHFHHELVHHGFTIEIVNTKPVFRDADGRVIVAVPPRPPLEQFGLDVLHEQHAHLGFDSMSAAPRWDGSPPDFHEIVRDLCSTEDDETAAWLAGLNGDRLNDEIDEWQASSEAANAANGSAPAIVSNA